MTRKLRSQTGRGLSMAFAGEVVVVFVCALYFLTRSTRLLVLGLALVGILGIASVTAMWRGQDEFGPQHRRLARRGSYWFLLASLLFLLAFFSFGTFPSPTTGLGFDNETSPTPPHQFKDLIPPSVLLAAAVAAETLSGAHYLWILVGAAWRRWVVGYAASGIGAAAAILFAGVSAVREFQQENGPGPVSQDGADYYFALFLHGFLAVFALVLVLTRVFALALLRHAKEKVAQAESEADSPEVAAVA